MKPTKHDSSGSDLPLSPECSSFIGEKLNEYAGISFLSETDIENIREKLAAFLLSLMRHQTERFYAFLYRVDVSEERVRAAVREFVSDEIIAVQIASLIIDRMKEKYISRKKYSEG
jgi:SRSO17 transposase